MAGGKGQKGKRRPPDKRPAPPAAAPPPAAPAGGDGGTARPKTTRAERLEAARQARRRKALMVRAGVAGAVAVVVAVVAVAAFTGGKRSDAAKEKLTKGSCTVDSRADTLHASPRNHVPPASYDVDPPAGGDHSPSAASAGVYGEGGQPVPSDAEVVHALEHGYVAVWYRPGLSAEEMGGVRAAYDAYPDDVLVVPKASLTGKAAATAWGRRLLCRDVEAASLTEFVRQYRNQGPEKVPHT